MPSAAGAYAESTGTIYLNKDWVRGAKQDKIVKVLTEEYGHHLDALLNSKDTQGDEGEVFAELLVSTKEIHSRNDRPDKTHHPDSGEITLHQAAIKVEFASTNPDGSIQLDGTEGRYEGSTSNDTIFGSALADEVAGLSGTTGLMVETEKTQSMAEITTTYSTEGMEKTESKAGTTMTQSMAEIATTIYTEEGITTLHGGDGNDTLHGGNYSDVVYGEGGNDRLINNKGMT